MNTAAPQRLRPSWRSAALVPDGRIQGRWTQKWPSKISCGLGSQRPRKRPNSKFPNCGLILTIIGQNWPKNLYQNFLNALFLMIWGVAGLRPNFFSSGRIFLAELAQESWRDLAAVVCCRSSRRRSDLVCSALLEFRALPHPTSTTPPPSFPGHLLVISLMYVFSL